MSEFEIKEVIEADDGSDWEVEIIYEYDGGIQINGVYAIGGSDDLLDSLDGDQKGQVEQHCIDHWAGLCDAAQAAAEDRGDWLYEQRKARQEMIREERQAVLDDNANRYRGRI